MSNLFQQILRFGITVSLSDRDFFIQTFSSFLEKYNADPVKAEKIAKILAACLEELKENLTLHNVVHSELKESGILTKEDVKELKDLLKAFTKELAAQKNKEADV